MATVRRANGPVGVEEERGQHGHRLQRRPGRGGLPSPTYTVSTTPAARATTVPPPVCAENAVRRAVATAACAVSISSRVARWRS